MPVGHAPRGATDVRPLVLLLSVAAVAVLVALLAWKPTAPKSKSAGNQPPAEGHSSTPAAGQAVLLYCAAGIQKPVDAAVRAYEKDTGVRVEIQFGGSGTLLNSAAITQRGELFIAGDAGYIQQGIQRHLIREVLPLARQRPVIAVARKDAERLKITSLADLARDGLKLSLANPQTASIGKVGRKVFEKAGLWEAIEKNTRVSRFTVPDVANDLKVGSAEAGVIWDALLTQYPELTGIHVPEFDAQSEEVTVGVLAASAAPAAALRFARYLAAPQKGQRHFQEYGYETVPGDEWADPPELLLYSGGLNRPAIVETLEAFRRREGCEIKEVYGGCGVLVAQMKGLQGQASFPDAYLACDVSFLEMVKQRFGPGTVLSETEVVILCPKAREKELGSLAALAKPGLKLGVTNAEQSTLGALTKNILEEANLYDAVMANVRSQTPTADLLVNQLQTGALDAVIVYAANCAMVRERFAVIPVPGRAALALQPFAVARSSRHPQLAKRLLDALKSAESRRRYEALGFRWRGGDQPVQAP